MTPEHKKEIEKGLSKGGWSHLIDPLTGQLAACEKLRAEATAQLADCQQELDTHRLNYEITRADLTAQSEIITTLYGLLRGHPASMVMRLEEEIKKCRNRAEKAEAELTAARNEINGHISIRGDMKAQLEESRQMHSEALEEIGRLSKVIFNSGV